jgi:hypothetical protein
MWSLAVSAPADSKPYLASPKSHAPGSGRSVDYPLFEPESGPNWMDVIRGGTG